MNPGPIGTAVAIHSPASHSVVVSDRGGLRDNGWIVTALDKPLQFALKRTMDVVVSAAALLVLLPLFLVIAAAIVIENRGPVFFSQVRWGQGGKSIRIFKFRSMRAEMCDYTGVMQTVENDPRVTRVGAMLRKTNLDEMPQLINILLGHMSLVGPRCHVPGQLAAGRPYEELVEDYHLRHLIRPGLSGLAQMSGFRGPTDLEEPARGRIVRDLQYIRNFSILLDIKILFQTFWREARGGTGF